MTIYNRKEADHQRYLRKKDIVHACVTCRRSFVANHKRKYCSVQCNPNIRIWDKSDRLCEACNTSYKPRTRYQRYCSSHCHPYTPHKDNQFYQSREWKQLRASFIDAYTTVNGIQISNKYCIECYTKHNRLNDMYAVDHKVRIKDNGDHSFNNLQSLCKHHHQSKSAVEGNSRRRG